MHTEFRSNVDFQDVSPQQGRGWLTTKDDIEVGFDDRNPHGIFPRPNRRAHCMQEMLKPWESL